MTQPTDEAAVDIAPCPHCGLPLTIRGGVNPRARCDTEDCWTCERKLSLPLDDARQVAQWNGRAQLTATTRRAEQAERMLAEAVKAMRNISPYLHWTIGEESPGHHPTMPSAVAGFDAARQSIHSAASGEQG